jgi:hypothetical protein
LNALSRSPTNRRYTLVRRRLTVLARRREDQCRARITPMPDDPVPETGQSKAKVFISYSRKDIAFAEPRTVGLKAA